MSLRREDQQIGAGRHLGRARAARTQQHPRGYKAQVQQRLAQRQPGRQVTHRGQQAAPRAGQGHHAQRHLGDQPQRAIGADEELDHIVAGHVLDHRPAIAQPSPVGQHHPHAQHQVADRAIAHALRAVEVGRKHAAQRAFRPGGDQRGPQPVGGQRLLQLGQRGAGLGRDVQILRRVGDHAAQLLGGEPDGAVYSRCRCFLAPATLDEHLLTGCLGSAQPLGRLLLALGDEGRS